MIKGSLMLHLGTIWYHSESSDVQYSENLLRPISWFGLFLQQNDSRYYLNGLNLIVCTHLYKKVFDECIQSVFNFPENIFKLVRLIFISKRALVRFAFERKVGEKIKMTKILLRT